MNNLLKEIERMEKLTYKIHPLVEKVSSVCRRFIRLKEQGDVNKRKQDLNETWCDVEEIVKEGGALMKVVNTHLIRIGYTD